MPPAAPRTCQHPDCKSGPPDDHGVGTPYVTNPDCATKAEVTEDYKTHIEVVHSLPLRQQELAVKQIEVNTAKTLAENNAARPTTSLDTRPNKAKLESIPRPKISANANESDWSFFSAQWERYVSGTAMTEQQQLN